MGSDPRLSGPALTTALIAGIARYGFAVLRAASCDVFDSLAAAHSTGAQPVVMGLSTTPACFHSCITAGYEFDGSIMLTASHLPWNRRVRSAAHGSLACG